MIHETDFSVMFHRKTRLSKFSAARFFCLAASLQAGEDSSHFVLTDAASLLTFGRVYGQL